MRKITEVLRLKAAGTSIRDIAASVGAGRTTVFEYLVSVYNLICRRAYDDICRSVHPQHPPLTLA